MTAEIFTEQRDGRWLAWFAGGLETFEIGTSPRHAVSKLVARFPVLAEAASASGSTASRPRVSAPDSRGLRTDFSISRMRQPS